MRGPLDRLRIIELAGIGPGPFAGMMMADHGAEVIRIVRPGGMTLPDDPVDRGRRLIRLDLKREPARAALLDLVKTADALIDPYRPGRLEALGLGADKLHAVNPRLVIGRLTGFGQHGPMSQQAGHDINFLSLSGLLAGFGNEKGRPVPPANLLGDYAGGAMMLCFGMLAALLEVKQGAQKGRIVDAAMVEGSALLGTLLYGLKNQGNWEKGHENNFFDGGMPVYGTYRCSDGRYLAVGALEPQFRKAFLAPLGLADDPQFADPGDRDSWEDQREAIAERLAAEPLSHWLDVYAGKDACVTPVLEMDEAPRHDHARARHSFELGGAGPVPAPAPRYEEAPLTAPRLNKVEEDAERALLAELGYDDARIDEALGR